MELFVGSSESCLSVSELTTLIKNELEKEFSSVRVIGEISNYRRQSSGHCYFSLKDESALINAVLFKFNAMQVSFPLRDGLRVIAYGDVSVYESRGQYQLIVRQLQEAGLGDLQARFEELKKRLQKEGLFEVKRKRPIPRHPSTVVVITSLSTAALRDFLQILRRRAPQIQVLIMPVTVQGKEAVLEICSAIERLNRWVTQGLVCADVLAIIRGGGSLEDLWAFNEESVARAISRSVLPTVCGIGHETDITIADLVADLRAPTPSAAAELISANQQEFLERMKFFERRLRFIVQSKIANCKQLLDYFYCSSILRSPLRFYERKSQKLDDLATDLTRVTKTVLILKKQELEKTAHRMALSHPKNVAHLFRQKLSNLEDRLSLLDPRNILKRGYAWVTNSQGKLLRSPGEVSHNEKISITLRDGTLQALAMKNDR